MTPRSDLADSPVTILLASFNGARFIAAQLDSIACQSHKNWRLIVSDDGSCDATCEIVRRFQKRFPVGQVQLVEGPKCGIAAENFLSLLRRAPEGYVAFCDQDDVWFKERLARGMRALHRLGPETLGLYGSRTLVTDANLAPLGRSPLLRRPKMFENALVQNFAGGNTMLATPAAGRLLSELAQHTGEVVAHDWWTYMVISACGGTVLYDPEPTIYYRQHGGNLVGANLGVWGHLRRFRRLLAGRYRRNMALNLQALRLLRGYVCPEVRRQIDLFEMLPQLDGPRALRLLRRLGLYRQSRLSQMVLCFGAFLGRL